MDCDHIHSDFGELFARTLLDELAKVWPQSFHQNFSLFVGLDFRDDTWKALAGSFSLLLLVVLEMVKYGFLLEVTLEVLLLVDLEDQFSVNAFVDVLLELHIEHGPLGRILFITINNDILVQIDELLTAGLFRGALAVRVVGAGLLGALIFLFIFHLIFGLSKLKYRIIIILIPIYCS